MAVQFDGVKISIDGYKKILTGVFSALGMGEQCVEEVTQNLLYADMRGTNSHGIARLKQYTTQIGKGFILAGAEPKVISDRGGALVIDGCNAPGAHVSTFAMQETIRKAKQCGMAFATVRNSSHFGVAAYYSTMALAEDQIGFSFTNTLPFVAHYGSMEPHVGTNPVSVAVPCGTAYPFVLDMATSVVARGNINNCAREGKEIPLGWAQDRNGIPTTDAKAALEGSCLPLGADRSYKGSGLCLAIDILCGILSGGLAGDKMRIFSCVSPEDMAKGPGICHAFGAIDISFYMDPSEFRERMDDYVTGLKAAKKAPGIDEILMPGEPELRQFEISRQNGYIPVAFGNFKEVVEITKRLCPSIDPEAYIVE